MIPAFAIEHGSGREPCRGFSPLCRPRQGASFTVALPPVDADAVANDRFPSRLARARLAVAHPAVSPVPTLNVRGRGRQVSDTKSEIV